MLQKNQLDYQKRNLFIKNELKRNLYKALLISLEKKKNFILILSKKNNNFDIELINSNIYFQLKFYLLKKIKKLPNNSFKTKILNRCIWTGRSKSILKKFKFSRIIFKKYASNGEIPGYFKYSW